MWRIIINELILKIFFSRLNVIDLIHHILIFHLVPIHPKNDFNNKNTMMAQFSQILDELSFEAFK